MTTKDRCIAAGLLFAAVGMLIAAFAAGPANAVEGAKGFESAKFRVEVKGRQTTTLHHTHEPIDGCDVSDFSTGRERVTFRSKPIVITAIHSPGTFNPEFFAGRRLGIPTRATIERSFTPIHDAVTGCEENGGGTVDTGAPDCGTRKVNPYLVKLEYPAVKSEHDRLMMTVAKDYEDPFHACEGGGPLGFPFLIDFDSRGRAIAANLSQDELFDPDFQKWISIARGTDKEASDDYWAQTHVHWEVSFTRLEGRSDGN